MNYSPSIIHFACERRLRLLWETHDIMLVSFGGLFLGYFGAALTFSMGLPVASALRMKFNKMMEESRLEGESRRVADGGVEEYVSSCIILRAKAKH